MKPKPSKAKTQRRIKARRCYIHALGVICSKDDVTNPVRSRFAIINLLNEAALIEQVARDIQLQSPFFETEFVRVDYLNCARAVLESLGIIKKLPATKTTDGS